MVNRGLSMNRGSAIGAEPPLTPAISPRRIEGARTAGEGWFSSGIQSASSKNTSHLFQDVSHSFRQRLDGERFLGEIDSFLDRAVMGDDVRGVAGHEQAF
jgi:hypothetical protein